MAAQYEKMRHQEDSTDAGIYSAIPSYPQNTGLAVLVITHSLAQKLLSNRNYSFWACQLAGWGAYWLVTFFSITVMDDNVSWPHIGHLTLTVALGLLTTWPMRPLYRFTFDLPLAQRLVLATLAVLVLGAAWTVLRIEVFAWMVGETAIWDEFNYWYFGSLFVFLSWTVLYYGIHYYELLILEHQKLLEESALKQEEHTRRLRAETLARDAQLQMLRYQLNPHFLFNTLNSINALVRLDETDTAQEMIQRLSDFLRHTLEEDCVATVSLEQELYSLMLYLDIEKTRFQDRLSLEFDIDPRARPALVPGLILQPIIENSMKYAIAPCEEGGTVKVSADVIDGELQLVVSDTGPGIDAKAGEKGRGVGLRNTVERLGTLYGDSYTFETINTTPLGLSVQIRVPFRMEATVEPEAGSMH